MEFDKIFPENMREFGIFSNFQNVYLVFPNDQKFSIMIWLHENFSRCLFLSENRKIREFGLDLRRWGQFCKIIGHFEHDAVLSQKASEIETNFKQSAKKALLLITVIISWKKNKAWSIFQLKN